MALHGSIRQFDGTEEDWVSYTERLEQYFAASAVTVAEKKRAVLLSSCGPATYKLIRSLAAQDKPSEIGYDALVTLMKDHYTPKPSVTVQRFKFNSRVRQPGESVANYAAELRRLTKFCEFGPSLSDMLRDRLICGINDSRMQCSLLAEKSLTFKDAFTKAQAMESADRDSQDLQKPRVADSLHVLRSADGPGKPSLYPCPRCGGKHRAADCRFRETVCHCCKKKGHLARVCRSKERQQQGQRSERPGKHHSTNVLDEGHDSDDQEVYSLFHLPSQSTEPIYVTVSIEDVQLQLEVDTGASVSVMSESAYYSTWPEYQRPVLQPSRAHICGGPAWRLRLWSLFPIVHGLIVL